MSSMTCVGVAVSARSSQRAAGRRVLCALRAARCALTLLFVAATASAQLNESITVSYVEVPVTVVDRGGNPIRGLTKANFDIVDEGKKRAIAGFDTVDFSTSEIAGAPAASILPAARRNFLLVFDLSFSSPSSMVRAQDAARNFVKNMAAHQDRIGIATVDVAHGFRLLTSFTTDHVAVEAAISDPQGFSALDPLQLAGSALDAQIVERMNDPSAARGGTAEGRTADLHNNMSDALADAGDHTDIVIGQNAQQDQYNRGRVERQVNLLAGLSKIMRAVRGQKHLVLLSEGFDPRVIQGRDAGIAQDQQTEAAAVESGEIWRVDNDNRYGSTASISLVSKMADVAKRCDVILDAVDIRGVRTQVDAREGYSKKSNEGLHLLANATGGTVFQNSNSLTDDFQRALKGQEVVYVLAFQAPVSAPGKFHNLKVKLVNVPGGRLVARSGYYEAGGDSAAERTLSNAEILVNDIEQEGLHVASIAAPFATSGANAQVPVVLEINGNDISGTDPTATLEIFTYAFDGEGKVRDSMFQRIGLDLSKVGATLHQSGVKYYETLSLPPGKYAVKSLVRVAESDKKGFVRTDIVVPAKGDVAVSSPLFQDQGMQWVMIKGASHDKTNSPYPFEVDGTSFIPSAAARVKSGGPRRFVVFVRNAAPDDLTVETTPEAKLVSKVRTEGGAKFLFELGSSPTASVLNVAVHKRGESNAMKSSMSLQ
jgi:VWFA-related protein